MKILLACTTFVALISGLTCTVVGLLTIYPLLVVVGIFNLGVCSYLIKEYY